MRGAEDGGPAERAGVEAGMGARHGKGDGRDAGPRPAPGDAPGTEALLAAALRGEDTDAEGERRAVAAFRAARDAEPGRVARTRRRDDWRPRTGRGPGRSLKTALSVLLASLTLGGVAYAAMGGGGSTADDGGPESTHPSVTASDDASVRPVATPPAATRGPGTPDPATTTPGGSTSPGLSTPPGVPTPPDHPAGSRDTEAQCRAYERLAGRGKALEATAWQRLVAVAGGAERVEAYCVEQLARPTGSAPTTGAGNGGAGNGGAGNGGAGETGAKETGEGSGADGIVGEGGVDVELGGSAAVRVPDQDGP
ncbi:hypothetical protein [Streptomyces coelicoflavus]|uniref:hypothetical protein n=1 Tax=Streptomyces coelicoflavus TaxID=285562 RepID=UPI002E255B6A